MERLNVYIDIEPKDNKIFLYKNQPLSKISYEELNKIKRNVKNELKKYD